MQREPGRACAGEELSFGAWGIGFRGWGLGIWGFGFRELRFMVQSSGIRVSAVYGVGFEGWVLGLRHYE